MTVSLPSVDGDYFPVAMEENHDAQSTHPLNLGHNGGAHASDFAQPCHYDYVHR
jgi:hypothetical protein